MASKLPEAEVEAVMVRLREYPGWTVGHEWRRSRLDEARFLEVNVDGWATNETIAAHDRGDTRALPTYFYEVRVVYEDGRDTWYAAGGPIDEADLRRRMHEHAMDAVTAAWDYVFGRIEAIL